MFRQLAAAFLISSFCLFGFAIADDNQKTAAPKTAADEADVKVEELSDYQLMTLFVDAFTQIETNYVRDIDRRELMESAIRGMVSELDQYSSYIPPRSRTRFERMLTQEFGGIGIQVNMRNGRLIVVSPVPGTPAYKAGILPGDIIMRIDQTDTKGLTMNEAINEMQGPVGRPVELRILRPGQSRTKQFTLNRELITVSTIRGYEYNDDDTWNYWVSEDPKIAYVRLSSFSRRSAEELKETLRTLVSLEMEGLVLDLRFNPGGLLEGAIEMADLFLKSGNIVSVKGRNVPERSWDARSRETLPDFPMAVLVNGYSASASEVLSACLQDNHRAIVVGERTWGKGSVQNVIRIDDGKSILKLTTASYHRPSGVNIHRFKDMGPDDTWGVLPDEDFEIPYSRKQWEAWSKDRAERDIVKRTDDAGDKATEAKGPKLDGPDLSSSAMPDPLNDAAPQDGSTPDPSAAGSDSKDEQSDDETVDSEAAEAADDSSDDSTSSEPFVDTQLNSAIDYIKGNLSKGTGKKAE